jgi:hypothetical protein
MLHLFFSNNGVQPPNHWCLLAARQPPTPKGLPPRNPIGNFYFSGRALLFFDTITGWAGLEKLAVFWSHPPPLMDSITALK